VNKHRFAPRNLGGYRVAKSGSTGEKEWAESDFYGRIYIMEGPGYMPSRQIWQKKSMSILYLAGSLLFLATPIYCQSGMYLSLYLLILS
jgi:quinol-cytochrome oxidoreductase complex cytochrome b subunit